MWKNIPKLLEPFQYSVWTEFTPLALKHQATNLGQGFPSFACPDFVKKAISDAAANNENQYSKPQGFPALTEEISKVYSKKHNRPIDSQTEILVTHGATEGLLVAFLSMVNKGDEVVIIDPSYDCYYPQCLIAGGIPKRVSLLPPSDKISPWQIDFSSLESAFTSKTRMFIFNTPNNPIGKVYTKSELKKIAKILKKWPNVAVLVDEVYEHIVFDKREHLSLCDLEDLWERTVTLSSAGKIFSVTGWKTGWAVGGPDLIRKMVAARIWVSFCSNTVCQGAISRALKIAEEPYLGYTNYYAWLSAQYTKKKDIMVRVLENSKVIHVEPLLCEGGFFISGRVKSTEGIPKRYLENGTLDYAFCRWMTEELKICAIPNSAFFSAENKHFGADLVRFALCKDYPDYDQTEKILLK